MHKHCVLRIAAILVILGSEASAQELTHLGSFHNVRQSNASGDSHCYGQSLELWQHGGRVLGLISLHEGVCGDPPCGVLDSVSFQPGTGRLTFSSVVGSASASPTKISFAGTIRRDDILGTLNGQRVRLELQREDISPHRSLAAWCQFWSRVPRCGGVQEICASRGQLQ